MKGRGHFPWLFARTIENSCIGPLCWLLDLIQIKILLLFPSLVLIDLKLLFCLQVHLQRNISVCVIFSGLLLVPSLVVWHNVTAIKDVLSLHFISRDNPLVAHSACHGAVALCSGTQRDVAQAFENSLIKCLSKHTGYANQNRRLYCLVTSSQMPQGHLASNKHEIFKYTIKYTWGWASEHPDFDILAFSYYCFSARHFRVKISVFPQSYQQFT